MKHTTTIALAVLVMAAAGCETDNTVYENIRASNLAKQQQPFKPKFQPGTDMLGIPPTPVVYRSQYDYGPAAQQQPQPIIVTGQGTGATLATQTDYGTVVSSFGGNRPIYAPPAAPIYTGNRTPVVYTMPLQQ